MPSEMREVILIFTTKFEDTEIQFYKILMYFIRYDTDFGQNNLHFISNIII
jgi:hypothetical protein